MGTFSVKKFTVRIMSSDVKIEKHSGILIKTSGSLQVLLFV